MPNQKRQTCLPEKTAEQGSVIMPSDSEADSKKYNGLIDTESIKQEEDGEERQERGPQPSLGPQEEEDRRKEKDTSDAADVKTEPASEGSGGATGENEAKEAEEERILEVLRVADELDNCLDGIRKEQSETEQRLGLADDSKEVSQLTQKRTAFVHLAHLIRKRMKELKEDCWKAIGEKSEGEEAFGALFKKIGEIRKETTKEIQGLKKQRHRTAKIDKRNMDCERKLNRLQKADDNLLYDLRILAIGCQKKLETIKEGKLDEVKSEVKEEPESQDQVIPAVDVSQIDAPILMEEAVEEEMDNDVTENQNQEFHNQVDFDRRLEDDLEESPDDSALVATPKPILEVLKWVEDLDKCLEDVGKVQSETKELFALTDNPKEICQLAQKRIALVQLANLIPQRLKELKEEGWKAVGEESEGGESIGDLFKKIGKTREEATKDLQCLKQCRRTAKIDEAIEDCEREVRRLQKAEDRLVYNLKNLATGCQLQLGNIKEGRAVEGKTDVKEPVSRRLDESLNHNQDSTHRKVKEEPEEEETAPINCNQRDARGYEFYDSHANDDQPPEDSPIRLHQMVKKRKRLFEIDEEASDGEPLGEMVDSEDEAVLIRKDSKIKRRVLLTSSIKNKSKEVVTGGKKKEEEGEGDEDDDMLGGGLGGFDESDDDEPTPVKDSVVKTKKKPLGRDASISGNDEEQDDMEMEDIADDDDSEKEDQEERVCPVDGCSKKSPSDEALKKHMPIHQRHMICRVCKMPWSCAGHLRRHYRVHSGLKPFQCPTCKGKFSRADHLKTHTRLHTGELPYECDLCGEKFKNSAALDYHRRKHSCSICDYRTASSTTLKRHMRSHMGEKPFKCSDCDHCFSEKAHLEEHKAGIHTGVKKHSCKECDHKTAYRKALSSHMKRVHQK